MDKIYIGAVQPASSSSPLIITAYPNLPFYFLWLPLIVNAYFIIKVIRRSATAKRTSSFRQRWQHNNVFAHVFFHSNNAPFSRCSSAKLHRNRGVSFWSFSTNAVSVGGSVVPLVVAVGPNLPSYAFLLSVILNACFIIKLLTSEKLKQTPS